jgi:lysophospholipase L1-like esterase
MARIGGRAGRWTVAASAAATTALIVTAGLTLSDDAVDLVSAAAGAQAVAASTPSRTSGAPEPEATAATASSEQGLTSPVDVSRPTATATAIAASAAAAASASVSASATPGSATPVAPPSAAVVTETLPPPQYPTVPGATPDAPFVSFIGDSWTYGSGATDLVGYAYLTGRQLGWAHRVLGVGGSGYVRGGRDGVPFGGRVAPAMVGNPDVVVVQGSINERETPLDQLRPAVEATLEDLRLAAGPDTTVLVVGASYVPGLDAALVDRVNDVVRAEAARRGLLFVDVAAEGWSDPADASVWADPWHVNDRGAQQVADRLAVVLQGLLAG